MSLPDPNINASRALRDSQDTGSRRILRGEISDDFGDGECVFTRLEQHGFDDDIEFVAGDTGITAVNSVIAMESYPDDCDDDALGNRELKYRYSVIPSKGCEIEYLRISIAAVDFSKMTLALTWRGERPAKIRILEQSSANGNDSDLDNRTLRQNEVFDISQIGTCDTGWYIEIPSHTVSISILVGGKSADDKSGSVLVTADAVFLQKNKVWNNLKPGLIQNGSGRIQPDQVLNIIEKAERLPETLDEFGDQVAKAIRKDIESEIGRSKPDDGPNDSESDIEPYSTSSAYIDVVVSQKIELFHGEDVILSTFSLFEDKVKDGVSYVSASLPEWMFLDQRSGDLMGTVPVHEDDAGILEFSIYAVDIVGNSAKAIIPVECLAQKFPAGADLIDHRFCEGSAVSITTIGMFMDFGLEVNGLEFSGEGLPEGLAVDPNDGLVKGLLAKGSADDAPYNIVVTASDSTDAGSGISMQFLLDVTADEQLAHSLNGPEPSMAMKNLYRMNRESERILTAGMVSKMGDLADGYSVQEMPLTGNRLPKGIENLVVPGMHLFAPEREIYLQVRKDGDEPGCNYGIQMTDKEELPDWIECTSDGLISIKCSPERRFVDVELVQKSVTGSMAVFDICVDTFEGSMMPTHRNLETATEKQIRQLSAA